MLFRLSLSVRYVGFRFLWRASRFYPYSYAPCMEYFTYIWPQISGQGGSIFPAPWEHFGIQRNGILMLFFVAWLTASTSLTLGRVPLHLNKEEPTTLDDERQFLHQRFASRRVGFSSFFFNGGWVGLKGWEGKQHASQKQIWKNEQ